MTQAKLAAALKVSRGAVGNWESAATLPSSARLLAIAAATKVPLEWLATGQGEAAPASPYPTPAKPVADPNEQRLLHAFRNCSQSTRRLVLKMLETRA
ncbi:MAG: helix-turn-helix domain-containing protein [Stenotrophomonas sp.]